MPKGRMTFVWAALGLVVILAIGAFAGPLMRALAAGAVDVATGDRVSFGTLEVHADRAIAQHVILERSGTRVLEADRIVLRYRVRDLFPGGAHRYGLERLDLERPRVILDRRADGTFDVAPIARGPGVQTPAGAGVTALTPLRFEARVHGGSIVLEDRFRVLPEARRLGITGLDGTLSYNDAGITTYRLYGSVENDALARMTLAGRIDTPRGYASHRLRARTLDIVPVVNYFIDNPAARFERGLARTVDVRLYGDASAPGRGIAYHVTGSLDLVHGAMRVPGIVPSVEEIAGRVDVFDGGFAAPKLSARLGELDARVAGGLYDYANLSYRLGIAIADAPLERTRRLFSFARDLPISGRGRLTTLLEGPAGSPLVATRLLAPALVYAGFPIERLGTRALYYNGALDVVGLDARYGGLAAHANGSIVLGNVTQTSLVVDVAGPAARIPYLAEFAPRATVRASGVLSGPGLLLDARGALAGAGGGTSLGGVFHENARGEGRYGPLRLDRADGASLAGAFMLERRVDQSAFWLDARHFPYAELPVPARLPGLVIAAPTFRGTLDGSLAGIGPPSDFRIAGDVRGRDLRIGGVTLASVAGHVAGTIGNFGLRDVRATGPWGTFAGRGSYVGPALALEGAYRGSFAQLRTFTGDLGASGPVDGGVALLVDPHRTVIQARGARTPGARVRGVPLDGASGTMVVTGKHVDIYAATGDVASGTLVAAGSLDGPGSLGVSLAGADAARLRALVPLGGGGRIAAIGTFGGVGTRSRFEGGLALGEGTTLDRLPVSANADVSLGGTSFAFRRGDAQLGTAVGSLDGEVAGVGTRAPRYDARLRIATARLGPFVRATLPARRDIDGSVTGDVLVRGTQAKLGIAGRIGIPEGTINGLAFRDASAQLAIGPGESTARAGTVTVGTTTATFGATVRGADAAFHLEAPRADLSDFNDYFDAGDMLGGRGRIAADFGRHGTSVASRADVAIGGLHVRRFDLGDATARWTSRGQSVVGTAAFGGASGRLEAAGVAQLPSRVPLNRLIERSRFEGTARLRGLDLGVWLPALGYQLPIGGRVDADATIAGPLRNPDVRTDATLVGGSLGKLPVERLSVSAVSSLRRTTVSKAILDLPGLSLVGSGSFGLGMRDPVALAVHAKSPDVGSVGARLFGATLPVTGVAEVDVKVDGTRVRPRIAGGFDLEAARVGGVAVPHAFGQFSLSGRDVVLTSVEVGFATGELELAGSVPLQVAPFGFGPEGAPISLQLAAKGIEFANFAPLLPPGSKLSGKLDGRVVVGGTAGAPRLGGALALAGGVLASPLETVPLTDLRGTLAFSGTEARLEGFHASAGGGWLDASGAASLVDLVRPGSASPYRFNAVANHLRLNLPAYGAGQVDGTLALTHARSSRARLTGRLALSDAAIPFAALLLSSGGTFGAAPVPAAVTQPNDVALDLDVLAERNVRVRSSNIDIGGRGLLHVGGTTGAPTLGGGFDSTGGTLTYFNTVFRLVDGRVNFTPEAGLIPTLDARAVTHVIDPDPNTVRNLSGSADVSLALSGPVTNLTIALSSDPAYDRQQILGLLFSAPALGASNLFGDRAGSPSLYGSTTLAGAPPGTLQARSNGQFSVAQEAFGIANAQFTRTLLAPIETTFAQAVGLSNFNVNVDYTGSVGLTARKVLGKRINAVYGTTFGYPYRQTFGFEIKPSDATAAQVTVFQTLGASGLTSLAPQALGSSNVRLQAAQPSTGTVGFSLTLQRLFK